MKNIKKFEDYITEKLSESNILKCIYTLSGDIKGFAHWQSPEKATTKQMSKSLYFLGYEEYEGIDIIVDVVGDNKISLSIDDEYGSNYIRERESDLEKFFNVIMDCILDGDLGDSNYLFNSKNEKFVKSDITSASIV
jgi:hypothetical protein